MRNQYFIQYVIGFFFFYAVLCGGNPRSGRGSNACLAKGNTKEAEVGLCISEETVECVSWDSEENDAKDLYVSVDGDDANDGLSPMTAFKSVQKALCGLSSKGGTTVHILPGTYRESVLLSFFAFETMVTIEADDQGTGEQTIFDGEGRLSFGIGFAGMPSQTNKNLTIRGLTFNNYTDAGIYLSHADTVVIDGNTVRNNGLRSIEPDYENEGFGIFVANSANITIQNNTLSENGPESSLIDNGYLGMAINTFKMENSTIKDNGMTDNRGGGILVEDGTNVIVSNNTITNNLTFASFKKSTGYEPEYVDGGIWVDAGVNILLDNNTVQNNRGGGIHISDVDYQSPTRNISVSLEGNTVEGNYFGLVITNMGECPIPHSITISTGSFKNNQYNGEFGDLSVLQYRYYPEPLNNDDKQVICIEWCRGENESCY